MLCLISFLFMYYRGYNKPVLYNPNSYEFQTTRSQLAPKFQFRTFEEVVNWVKANTEPEPPQPPQKEQIEVNSYSYKLKESIDLVDVVNWTYTKQMNNLIRIGSYEYEDIVSLVPREAGIFRPFFVLFFPYYDQQNLMLGMISIYVPVAISISVDLLVPAPYRQPGKVIILQLKQEMAYDSRPSINSISFEDGKYLQDYPTGSETAIVTPAIQVTIYQNYVTSEPTFTDSLFFSEDFIKYLTTD